MKTAPKIPLLQLAAGGYLLLVTLLLPLKFGTLAVLPEAASFFPGEWFAYLIVSWPAHLFGIVAGVGLAAALAAFPPDGGVWRTGAGRCALLWGAGLPLVSLLGWIHAETFDYAFGETAHLTGCGAYVLAVYLMLTRRPEWRTVFLTLLALGVCFLIYSGLQQYFQGFRETRQFVEAQIKAGAQISDAMRSKIEDDRVFATFVSCNVLAGYLLLLLPLTLAGVWRLARRFEPARISQILFTSITGAGLFAVLLLTRSRGAYLAALAMAGLTILMLPMKKSIRWFLIAGAGAVLVGGAFYIHHAGRGFGSMAERVDYIATATRMTVEKPVTGYGWGGFFYRHMQLKSTDNNESAHDPHNFVLAFSSQCGVAGGILALAAILYPLWLLGRGMMRHDAEQPWYLKPVFLGEAAFLFHALMEISLQIPASMAVAGALFPAVLTAARHDGDTPKNPSRQLAFFLLFALIAAAAIGLNQQWLRGEIAFEKLSAATRPQSVEELARHASPAEVSELLRENRKLRPWSPFPWEAAGDYFLRIGDLENAETCYRKALERTSLRPSLHLRLFELERRRGNTANAREHLLTVYRLFPVHREYRKLVQEFAPEALRPVPEK